MTLLPSGEILQSSLFLPINANDTLHLRRICLAEPGLPVLMVHGAVANARTFYSERGRGLAPWLAARGFDVYVLDLRGRGLSTPPIDGNSQHGQTDSICTDIPAALTEITRLRGEAVPIRLVAHSWGGVLLSAELARQPGWASRIAASVYLGSKRSIRVWNFARIYEIELFWQRASSLWLWRYGYLPAARIGLGADSETRQSLLQSRRWIRERAWRDSQDGFDYQSALAGGGIPPTLYLVGGNDPVRGHERDVRRFVQESGPHPHEIRLMARQSGFSRDYGHLDMLTHVQSESEVYPLVLAWLIQQRS
ncbi:alpha/beta fold hydrolase [Chitinimonas sp. BJB300]|uniref:alpha/beta fold hydrolase n=1 Tax=Chitinimonas sp. BJB300 TaxID=1559339 RepID=UPI000C1186EC|nr:alpha/beta fold hydrolase [Chitinimonas sp. BJB300]PHV13331.1 esterase [Chitinimonas sp. BJB300]TSJ85247.1 alpha/beta fold hydrolase [Chitinimonas sp. BJB300]